MSDFREEEKLGKLYDSHLTRRLMKYLRPYRWQVALAVSITLGVTARELVGPYFFHVAIDGYILPGFAHNIARSAALRGLAWVVVAYLGSLILGFGLQYAQVRIMQWVGQETMYDLRKEIFEHLQRLPMSFFDSSPVGRLVTRATTDVDALNDLFASGVVAMLNDFVLLFSMAAVLFKWHPLLALATLAPLPFRAPVKPGGGALQWASLTPPRHTVTPAIHAVDHVFLPEQGAQRQPANPHGHCANQRFSAGTHQRHGRGSTFQSRTEITPAIRAFEPRAHGGVQGRY